ncbi:hypothetical protein PCASD_14542 [Puccinia coronata f. sp. avenae]|uniref:Uncharacterized protein n=1 Tax=Puccinia coronata f. sp. avenae TaxID=200324 RepID=A0A2N5TA14_9BASI|nr:hypothetical protein PCASD_14542 [Puccinia coronata f. sp. avenae]
MGGGNGYDAPLNQGMRWGRASIAAMVSCLAAQLARLLDMYAPTSFLRTAVLPSVPVKEELSSAGRYGLSRPTKDEDFVVGRYSLYPPAMGDSSLAGSDRSQVRNGTNDPMDAQDWRVTPSILGGHRLGTGR